MNITERGWNKESFLEVTTENILYFFLIFHVSEEKFVRVEAKNIQRITTFLSPKARDKRLHMHGNTSKAITRNNTPSKRDDNLTYPSSSPKAASDTSEHENEQYKVQTSVTDTNKVHETAT